MDYVDEVSKQLRRSEHSCFWPEATSSHGSKIGASTVPRTVACLSLPFTFQSLPCDEYATHRTQRVHIGKNISVSFQSLRGGTIPAGQN